MAKRDDMKAPWQQAAEASAGGDAEQCAAAASLLVMRDTPDGAELLIVRRAAGLAFGGGALVFPGGRVEPEDWRGPADDPEAAARHAAVRETREETGIACAVETLHPFARWRAPPGLARRFDTRFFLAPAPGAADPRADGVETDEAFWARPAALLAAAEARPGLLLFPTFCLLARLAALPDYARARADAEAWPRPVITPRVEQRADGAWLAIDQGLGYPRTARPVAAQRRA
ncbi:NUDIX hydrolase [Sphingomonas morindae]|uniref:NUDIX hydrolase n=1 Tax=Sphingomonas morindae TaxID=1541170 RepID=A0ABY4X9X7_9SPHN|nr:NUDIX hydrolase [Sphingomonas morindae]USI73750.1 NUDIX hydrolase [Sphingomonas morindae]